MQPDDRRPPLVPLFLLLAGAALFAGVSLDVEEKGLLARADPRVARWSSGHVNGAYHSVVDWLTWLGDVQVLAGVVLFGMAWLFFRRRFTDAIALGVGASAAGLLTTFFKETFQRARPPFLDPHRVPHSFSFPSGHTSGAFTVYLLLAVLLTATLTPRLRLVAVVGAALLAAAIGATRVLLPVHYLADVLAGACLGVAVVGATLLGRNAVGVRG